MGGLGAFQHFNRHIWGKSQQSTEYECGVSSQIQSRAGLKPAVTAVACGTLSAAEGACVRENENVGAVKHMHNRH